MNIQFSNVVELKQHLMPALKLRKKELQRKNIPISEDKIWDYLVDYFWKQSVQLSLAQMVDDILNKPISEIDDEILQ